MKNGASAFDDLDELTLDPEDGIKGADTPGMAERRRKLQQKQSEQFTKFFREAARKLAPTKRRGSWPVVYCLLELCWKHQSSTVTLTNLAVKDYGVSRGEKLRALTELETLKLIEIDKAGDKKSPRVTLLLPHSLS